MSAVTRLGLGGPVRAYGTFAAKSPSAAPSAYLQARAGIARAGVTYAGWVPPNVTVTINGENRFSNILLQDFTITQQLDGNASECRFTIKNLDATSDAWGGAWGDAWAPGAWSVSTHLVGNDVQITYYTPARYLFAGTILQADVQPHETGTGSPLWHCVARDYCWLMDTSDLVLWRYENWAVNSMVGHLLERFTEGGFRVGYIPSDLGKLSMAFTFEAPTQCLRRIAEACSASWEVTANKVVNMFPLDTYPEAAMPTLSDGADVRIPNYGEDLSQVRTREVVRGKSARAVTTVSPLATEILVDDIGPFVPGPDVTGGTAIHGRSVFTYASVSTGSGEGSLLGCDPRLDDINEGDDIAVYVDTVDLVAQAQIAAAMGYVTSGQISHYQADERRTASEAEGRAARGLATLSETVASFDFSSHDESYRRLKVGRTVTAAITSPIRVSGEFRIQSIAISPVGGLQSSDPILWRHVHCSQTSDTFTSLMRSLVRTSEEGR